MPDAIRPCAREVGASAPAPDDLCLDEGRPYWRMTDGAGSSMVATRGHDGAIGRVTPASHNVRSIVQGYGGGAFCVHAGTVFYVNHADQCIYRLDRGNAPLALTQAGPYAHGDLTYDAHHKRIVCVREALEGAAAPGTTELVAVAAFGGHAAVVLAGGRDFYMSPRISNCGTMLAWISWNHPNMPWDTSSLELAKLDAHGAPYLTVLLDDAGGNSVIEPRWSSHGHLYYLSDRNGWWNLCVFRPGHGCRPVHETAEEYGFPPYILGLRSYTAPSAAERGAIYACRYREGQPRLVRIDDAGSATAVADYTDARCLQLHDGVLWFIHAASATPPSIVRWDPCSGRADSFCPAGADTLPGAARPRALRLARAGADPTPVYGNVYLPAGADAGDAQLPLLVNVHGGPTGIASAAYNPAVQYWVARGYAYFDLNHRGSTGFGRRYREQLNGHWGVAEVEDAVEAVLALVRNGVADPARVAIRGHSAGGFTVLRAVTGASCFAAAACYYGVADLAHLRATTHKFESRYLDRLLGAYSQHQERFHERSPLFHADAIDAPVLFLHGALDRIVPPDQTRAMAGAMCRAGKIAPHIEFAGEGHGFRQPANIAAALDIEHYFYCRVFGRAHADTLDPSTRAVVDHAFGAPSAMTTPSNA